jgi:hypothetical protein
LYVYMIILVSIFGTIFLIWEKTCNLCLSEAVYFLPFPALFSNFKSYIMVFDPRGLDFYNSAKDMIQISVFHMQLYSFPSNFLSRRLSFVLHMLWVSLSKIMWLVAMWIYVVSSILFHCASTIHFFIVMTLRYSFQSGIVISPVLLFLLRIVLIIHGVFWFYMNFRIDFLIFVMNVIVTLIGIALNNPLSLQSINSSSWSYQIVQ